MKIVFSSRFLSLQYRRTIVSALTLSGCMIMPLANAADDSAPATGTYADEQFQRGETLYIEECAACHGVNLEGVAASTLIGPTFRKTWSRLNANVGELFNRISISMPPGQLGRLGSAENLDILAYLLGRNNVLVGTQLLNEDYNYLAAIELGRGDEALDIAANFIEGANGLIPTGTGPSFNDLANAASNANDWLYHNHNYQGTRYSALNEINTTNVGELIQKCTYQFNSKETLQTGPIVYKGVMYVTNKTHTAAIDAATCQTLWRHDWEPRDRMVWAANRGVAIVDGYVVRGTNDGYLFALDAANGELLWARQLADPWLGETFTMPPMIFEDTVLIGPAGSENAISGWVAAFKLSDGELVWKFQTVPGATLAGGPTWGNPNGILLGGGAVWTPLSMDLELGEVYVAVTNPAPDFPAYLRPGENLYTNSIVALDARTGALKWHRSIVPNDDHDWDLTQVSPVLKANINNVSRDLVVTVGKDGVLRTLDKQTHEPLYEVAVTTLENVNVPVTPEGVHACPGVNGGVLWNGPAYDPQDKLLIVPAIDYCNVFTAVSEVRHVPGQLYMGGGVKRDEEMSGWLSAIEVETGIVRWKFQTPLPLLAAVTTTAGGLAITGDLNGNLLLVNAATGEVLRAIFTGAPIGGGVVSYAVDGKQYIAATSGNPSSYLRFNTDGSMRDGSIIVYTLP